MSSTSQPDHSKVRAKLTLCHTSTSLDQRYKAINPLLDCKCLAQSIYQLTRAEKAVAQMFVDGATYKEIASHRKVSVQTVKSQIARILDKTMTRNRVELLKLVLAANITQRGVA